MRPLDIRAVLVEDEDAIRAGVRASLTEAGIRVIGEAANGHAGIEVIRQLAPDVAVIDLDLPGEDGILITRTIKAIDPPPGVVIFTGQGSDEDVVAVLAAGADGYCVKSSGPEILIDAVRLVADGGAYFDPSIARSVLRRFGRTTVVSAESPLSPRETEVLSLVSEGLHNAEIAQRLNMALGTVKRHVEDILEKLAASDRAHAAATALRRGYL